MHKKAHRVTCCFNRTIVHVEMDPGTDEHVLAELDVDAAKRLLRELEVSIQRAETFTPAEPGYVHVCVPDVRLGDVFWFQGHAWVITDLAEWPRSARTNPLALEELGVSAHREDKGPDWPYYGRWRPGDWKQLRIRDGNALRGGGRH